jgi:hypothetical protein
MTNKLTYQEALNLVKKLNRPVKLGVDNNPRNRGGYNKIYFVANKISLNSYETNTGYNPSKDDVDYEWGTSWEEDYEGSFYLLEGENYEELTLPSLEQRVAKLEAIMEKQDISKMENTETDKPQHKYKVGDRVRIVNSTFDLNEGTKGLIGRVMKIKEIRDNLVQIQLYTTADWWAFFNLSDIEPAEEPKQETKPTQDQEFWENGAVKFELEVGQEFWFISTLGEVQWGITQNDEFEKYLLLHQNIFITEESAEKWLDVLDTHHKYCKIIDDINRENGWQVDWNNDKQRKYYLSWDYKEENKITWTSLKIDNSGQIFMCAKAAEYMRSDKVSDSDFKKFLKIVE